MTDYEAMILFYKQLGVQLKGQESMEFVTGGMRRILWLYIETTHGEIDFKFDTYGKFEGMDIRCQGKEDAPSATVA